jgi:hypothetical protein
MVSSIPEMDNRQGIEPDQSSPQAAALAAAQRQFAEQMPDLVATEHRDALAAARARQEVLGEEPDDDYAALVTQAADQVQQGYQDAYGNAGVEDEVATQAAIAQRKQFLGEPLATAESTAVEAADGIVEAKRKEYGRTINDLKDRYRQDLGGWGDPNLSDAAAQIRAGQQVYGNDPSEKQSRLLQAADIQRQQGVSRQLQQDYEVSGTPSNLAQAAGDIKAKDYVFGAELSDAQVQRMEQADRYLSSPDGQLSRAQEQRFMAVQVGRAYEEGRTSQALEDAGVDADLAAKAARIQAQTQGEPESPEDRDLLQTAYASADGLASPMAADIAANAEQFMNVANEAGVTTTVGATTIAQGNRYTMSRTAGVTVVENQETGGSLAVRDGAVLDAEGLVETDQERFQQLAQVSPEDLQRSAQRTPAPREPADGMEVG